MTLPFAVGNDVSSWQDNSQTPRRIYWELPRQHGVRFVINRAVMGAMLDEDFPYDWQKQKEQGYLRGAYGFWDYRFSAGAPDTKVQARAFVQALKDDPGEWPEMYMDVEQPNQKWPALPPRQILLPHMETYIKTVEDGLGMPCGTYTSPRHIRYDLSFWWDNKCVSPVPDWLRARALWVAAWVQPEPGETYLQAIERSGFRPNLYGQWETWRIWQFGFFLNGKAMGYESEEVDADFFNGTPAQLEAFCNAGGPVVTEPPAEGENEMWNDVLQKGALIAAFDKAGSYAAPAVVDFAALKAAGVHAVLLRAGTSSDKLNYDQPDAGYIHNVNFPTWLRAAEAAGLKVLVEYDFCPVLDSVNSYNGTVTLRHINFLLSGGNKPKSGGGLILNLERNTWSESIRVVTCVSSMYGQDLRNVFNAIWDAHKLVPGVRTGRWFLDRQDDSKTSIASQLPWLDKGQDTVPLFLARPKRVNTLYTGSLREATAGLVDPAVNFVKVSETQTVNEQAHYLFFGNNTRWMGWEFGWVRHASVLDDKGQPATFRLILWHDEPGEFDKYFNIQTGTTDPGNDTPGTPSSEDLKAVLQAIAAVNGKLDTLQTAVTETNQKLDQIGSNFKTYQP